MAVFGVRVAEEEKSKAALLRIHAPHGYPGVESLSYSGSYPVSRLIPGKWNSRNKIGSTMVTMTQYTAVYFPQISAW